MQRELQWDGHVFWSLGASLSPIHEGHDGTWQHPSKFLRTPTYLSFSWNTSCIWGQYWNKFSEHQQMRISRFHRKPQRATRNRKTKNLTDIEKPTSLSTVFNHCSEHINSHPKRVTSIRQDQIHLRKHGVPAYCQHLFIHTPTVCGIYTTTPPLRPPSSLILFP